jgi:hypothetical protein
MHPTRRTTELPNPLEASIAPLAFRDLDHVIAMSARRRGRPPRESDVGFTAMIDVTEGT